MAKLTDGSVSDDYVNQLAQAHFERLQVIPVAVATHKFHVSRWLGHRVEKVRVL